MAKSTQTAAADTATAPAGKIYKVIINKDDSPGGKSDLVLTINGRNVQIQRGKEVPLTEAMLEVLRNAEVRGYEASADGKTSVVSGMPRFSYVVLGEAREGVADESIGDPAATVNAEGTGFAAP